MYLHLGMSEQRKAHYDGLFFVTLTLVGWVDVFTRKDYANIVVKNLQFCQQNKGLEIYAYVIMSNHVHLIARQKDGNLNNILGRFKSYSAKAILQAIEDNQLESRKDWMLHVFRFHAKFKVSYDEYHFWQNTNHPVELYTPEVIFQKLHYIHNNPVRAGYVEMPEHWMYSSANPNSPIKVLPL